MTEPQITSTNVDVDLESTVDGHIPAISIGMPVYNGAKYIREALDALLAQSFTDFELIISDNASTDSTQAICEEYLRRDLRIRYIRQSGNGGAVANFQFVLQQARGEFFMWAAADDRWDAHWIKSIYSRISCEKHLAGFGDLVHIDARAQTLLHPASGATFQFGRNRLWRKIRFYLTYEGLGKANLLYAIYPREALQPIDLRSYRFDYQILFMILDRVAYAQIRGVSLYKRIHGESEGSDSESVRPCPAILAPFRILRADLQLSTNYLPLARSGLRMFLLLLIPVKLIVALRFHVLQRATRWREKLHL